MAQRPEADSGEATVAHLMSLVPAQEALLLELQLAGHASGGARDAHDAAVVHVYLPNDQVVDAGHHLQNTRTPMRAAQGTITS